VCVFNIFGGGKWYEPILFIICLPVILLVEKYQISPKKSKKKNKKDE